jgi:hypothetical protein
MEEDRHAESSHLNQSNNLTAQHPATVPETGSGIFGSGQAQIIRTATGTADQTDADGGSESPTGGIIQ